VAPSLILFAITGPSIGLLYALDEVEQPDVCLKVIGNQWYWVYEFDYVETPSHHVEPSKLRFQSFMLEESFLPLGGYRLLETDNVLVLPAREQIQVLITSSDVLHS
jgi:cytochrome c oxidase subunit 2